MEKIRRSWNSSTKSKKQRKFRANAQWHIRRKFFSANLSEAIRKKYSKRSFPLRKGDTVRIMKGEFCGKTGKVIGFNLRKLMVYIEGIQRNKKDGTKINVPIHPSNLQITEMALEDKKRVGALERKKVIAAKKSEDEKK